MRVSTRLFGQTIAYLPILSAIMVWVKLYTCIYIYILGGYHIYTYIHIMYMLLYTLVCLLPLSSLYTLIYINTHPLHSLTVSTKRFPLSKHLRAFPWQLPGPPPEPSFHKMHHLPEFQVCSYETCVSKCSEYLRMWWLCVRNLKDQKYMVLRTHTKKNNPWSKREEIRDILHPWQ